jgi:hypothetical protein
MLLLGGLGCAHVNNPFEDSSAFIDDEMKTTSSEAYETGRAEFPQEARREWPQSDVSYQNGSVTHWPLWFEDPFEVIGNRYHSVPPEERDAPDNVFARNWVDYMDLGYSPARLLVNVGAYPVSAIVQPPGTLMESDGHLNKDTFGIYDVDSRRADSVTREPPHMSIIKRSSMPETAAPEPQNVAPAADEVTPAHTSPS